MTDLIRTILIMSISGGIIALLLFVLKMFARNRLPKSTQYYLWLVVVAALLIPVSVFVKLPVATENAPTIVSPSNVVERYVITSEEEMDRMGSLDSYGVREASNPIYMQAVKDAESPITGVVTFFSFIYPLGMLIALLYYIINYSVFVRLYRRRNTAATADEIVMLAELCGGKRTPLLYRNPLAATPMLIGIFRPAIILPDREYTDAQLHAVLLHELTHLRRKDVLVKWLSVLVTTLHWFNPIVWLVRREIDRACELSCDEAVIRNLDTDGKQNYGETLLYVAANTKTPHAVLSTTMCEEKKALKERLGAIMKSKKHTHLAVILSAVLIVVVGGTAIALGAGRSATDDKSEVIRGNGNIVSRTFQTEVFTNVVIASFYDVTYEEADTFYVVIETAENLFDYLYVSVANETLSLTQKPGVALEHGTSPRVIIHSPYGANIGKQLSLDEVRALAAKGDALQYSDLPNLRPSMLSSTMGGYNPTLYGVEGGYRLLINFNDTLNPESGIRSTALESIWESGGSGIDIRYNDVDEFIRTHLSHPADTVPPTSYTPREWINRENLDYSLTTTVDLMLDEFPDVLFSYTPENLTATNKSGAKELFGGTDGFIFGGYIDRLYLADLNGDGLPEFCGTTNYGSGFGDERVIIYDYANDKRYVLSDRGTYDYTLSMDNERLVVTQMSPMQRSEPLANGSIAIIDGELVVFGIDRTLPETDPKPSIPPRDATTTLHEGFYEIVRKLYDMDEGLNSEIKYIAVDTYGVIESERIPLEVILENWVNSIGYELLLMNSDELVKAGYMTTEPIQEAGFHEGVLFTFDDANFINDTLTVRVTKYRGPLGAVGAEFTAQFIDGNWTVEEPEMVYMA